MGILHINIILYFFNSNRDRMGITHTLYFAYNVQLSFDGEESIKKPSCVVVDRIMQSQFIMRYDIWIGLICHRNESFTERSIIRSRRYQSVAVWSTTMHGIFDQGIETKDFLRKIALLFWTVKEWRFHRPDYTLHESISKSMCCTLWSLDDDERFEPM